MDIVVVYKVDRLTRSLTDFAKLVELFDRHGVSFVSVTQAFNTTTSMGRLTLNVLLSFAQFEREVIGERVRDKIAASKKKGLFMGDNIPLGYTNREKKLVTVPEEAERVRWIFNRYLELGSIGLLLEERHRLDVRTKVLPLSSGKKRGGVSYGKGALAYLLKNRCYIGQVVHQGTAHAADHDPIIEKTTFDAVQVSLAANAIARRARIATSDFLLTGLLFDSAGNRMTPSHSRKKGVRYRYYVSQAVLQSRKADAGQVFRVAAPEVEAQIESFVRARAKDPYGDLQAMVTGQLARVTVEADRLRVDLAAQGGAGEQEEVCAQTAFLPWSKRSFRATKGAIEATGSQSTSAHSAQAVLAAIGRARHWVRELTAGATAAEIARREGKSVRFIRMLLPLAFTPPHTVRALIEGRILPAPVSEMAKKVPLSWTSQPARRVAHGCP